MQTSQRGSVLLTIIGGIVILALLGMVAVSLMTGSVMTGLDAKETVQASYLAESGKEIVRVQTSKADTGARLMTLVDDTLDGKNLFNHGRERLSQAVPPRGFALQTQGRC